MNRLKSFFRILLLAAVFGCTARLFAGDDNTGNSTAFQYPGFRGGLVWIGTNAPSAEESNQVSTVIGNINQSTDWSLEVEKFLRDYPTSPWAASLHNVYASRSRRAGRVTKALIHWEAAWELLKNDTSPQGRRLGGEILGNWTQQLSSLGRRDKLQELVVAGDQWPFANRLDRERFQSAKRNYYLMGRHPEISFRCGTLALKAVGQMLQLTNPALQDLVQISSPTTGFSMAGLADLAKQYGLDLVAVRRTQGQDLIVPSVIHWRQNHYAAILAHDGENYLVNDPTFGKPKWMQGAAINEEASGAFLIPASAQTADWQRLDTVELASIHGKGLPNDVDDAKDKGCTTVTGAAKDCNCPGMPVWWVSEPYNNLWIADEPLSYLTSAGEPFTFRVSFKQRGLGNDYPFPIPGAFSTNGLFNPWTHSWFSYIALTTTTNLTGATFPSLGNSDAVLSLPNGGQVDFAPGQSYDQETRLLLQQVDPALTLSNEWGRVTPSLDNGDTGLRIIHADGSQDIYGYGIDRAIPGTDGLSHVTYMLSRQIDPAGRTTTFIYGGASGMLESVVDYDGRTNTLTYTFLNNGIVAGYVLTSVTNAYGLSAHFNYDSNLNLTNIIDAAGLSSSLKYDTNGDPTSLITPYGTNTFALYENSQVTSTNDTEGNFGGDNLVDRAVLVTDPTGGKHLYLYRYDCSEFMATNFATSDLPTGTPLGTLDAGTGGTNLISGVAYRNSFSWDARQYAALSTTNFTALSSNDFVRGRMKHWLQDTNDLTLAANLSVERAPSPDGTTEGLKTFYDYQGKIHSYQAGTNPIPSVTAWRLPGGETHYEYVQYDYFGNVTNRVTTYSTSAGSVGTRTNRYVFADNVYSNVVFEQFLDSSNNPFYLPFSTNTFTVPDLLTKIIEANGSNVWAFGGFDGMALYTNFEDLGGGDSNMIVLSALRILPKFATNGVNEVTTRTYNGFNQITSTKWPAGLTTTNIYNSSGFLVQSRDIEINRTNSFAYSTNGLPSIHTNELGLVTSLFWDNLLRPTGISFPDSTTISNIYTNLDVGARKDRLSNWTYFGYDGLRHLTSLTNANHAVTSYGWCDCGALTSITDPLTNTTTLNYDFQSRLTNMLFADLSSLNHQYDLAGRMTNSSDGLGRSVNFTYNNQGLVTNWSNAYGTVAKAIFDILDRPTSFTDANNVTTTNSYDALDRLLTRVWVTDGVGESFGYATNGLVAYTNRNQKPTHFARDAAGRLTGVTNANSEVTQFLYDPSSNLTNLIDGLTNKTFWNYNQFGWVTNKVDASNHVAFLYTYNANGWLTNRWMPASGNTQYKFDAVGNLTNIVYSNAATAAVSYVYDAANRLTNMVDAIGTTAFSYTAASQLASEAGPWPNDTIGFLYNQGHRTNLSLSQPSGAAWNQGYGYDNEWRLTSLTSPAGSFAYGYTSSPSALIQSLGLPNAAGITYQYDTLGRLTNTSLANYWGQVLDGYGYAFDSSGQRTNISRYLGITTNRVGVSYDNIGQLVSWAANEAGGAVRLNEQLGYGYDAANNLHFRTNGTLVQTFNVDVLNELSTATRSGTLTVTGATPAPATNITVNGNTAQTYGDFSFARTNNTLSNGSNTFTVIAQNLYGVTATNTVNVNFPATNSFLSDANGNLTNDGLRNFVYNAENELTNINVAGQWKIEFVYDGFWRKRIERDYAWQSSNWVKTNETRFIYDGLLPIQERDSNNVVQVTYTRGVDLSGSRNGAGGIGALLARTDANGSAFYHSDGGGNITALIDGNQNIVGRYEYDGFLRLLGQWGPLAPVNEMRGSSMPSKVGINGYPGRFYDPTLQRWLNRDPSGETDGFNLYGFLGNAVPNEIDPTGFGHAMIWHDEGPDVNPYSIEPGIQSTDMDFLPFFLPEVPAVSRALDAIGDVFGNLLENALEKTGLRKPRVPTKCPAPKPPTLYRKGKPNPGNLKQRAQDVDGLSTRSTISNPVPAPGNPPAPVFKPGDDFFGFDTSSLPDNAIIPDPLDPFHYGIKDVAPEQLKQAVIPESRGTFPK